MKEILLDLCLYVCTHLHFLVSFCLLLPNLPHSIFPSLHSQSLMLPLLILNLGLAICLQFYPSGRVHFHILFVHIVSVRNQRCLQHICCCHSIMSWNGWVSKVAGHCLECPDSLWGQPSLSFCHCTVTGGFHVAECEADHSPPFSTEVKNT